MQPREMMVGAHNAAAQAAHRAHPWVEKLARLGYVIRAAIYLTIGALAVRAAVGMGGGRTTDMRGVMRSWIGEPFGQILLGLAAAGLAGYALWQFSAAVFDPDRWQRKNQSTLASVGARAKHVGVGVIHAGLAFSAYQLLTGSGNGGAGSDASSRHWVARLLEQPFGPWLVGIAGVAVIAGGVWQIVRAVRGRFLKRLATGEMSPTVRKAVTFAGRTGIAARGIVFGVAGVFVLQAARHTNASRARGFSGALRALAESPLGTPLFALVAAGLFAFGIFELLEARYRRIQTT